jgi:hypothetical protein
MVHTIVYKAVSNDNVGIYIIDIIMPGHPTRFERNISKRIVVVRNVVMCHT